MRSWTDEQLIDAVKTSTHLAEAIRKLGFESLGSHYHWIKKHIKRLNISTAHFKKFKAASVRRGAPIETYLKQGIVSMRNLKGRLIKEGFLKDKCAGCGITTWTSEITKGETKLSLHIDHIDGVNTNNNLENLRLLCPNCHSVTDTYCGKNVKRETKYFTCKYCSASLDKGYCCASCREKNQSIRQSKIENKNWPDIETIKTAAKGSTFVELGIKFNCTDSGLRKYLKRMGRLKEVKELTRAKNYKS